MFLRFIFLVVMTFLAIILIFGEKVRGESALVNMTAIGWTPAYDSLGYSVLHEAWRFEKRVPLEHCLIMNRTFSGGGRYGAITVKCGDVGMK